MDPVQSAQLSFESCQETVRIFVGPSRVQITQDCAAGILTNVFAIAGRTMSCDEGDFEGRFRGAILGAIGDGYSWYQIMEIFLIMNHI